MLCCPSRALVWNNNYSYSYTVIKQIVIPYFIYFSKPSGTGKALKLGSKKKDVDTFVGQLESEGQSKIYSSKYTKKL